MLTLSTAGSLLWQTIMLGNLCAGAHFSEAEDCHTDVCGITPVAAAEQPLQRASSFVQRSVSRQQTLASDAGSHRTALSLIFGRLDREIHRREKTGHGLVRDDDPARTSIASTIRARRVASAGAPYLKSNLGSEVLVEVHVPKLFNDIDAGPQGPMPTFIATLKQELCDAASLPQKRIEVMDIRIANKSSMLHHPISEVNQSGANVPAVSASKPNANEIIIDLLVWPAGATDPTPTMIVSTWTSEISLRPERFSLPLTGATFVSLGTPSAPTVDVAEVAVLKSSVRPTWSLSMPRAVLLFITLCVRSQQSY